MICSVSKAKIHLQGEKFIMIFWLVSLDFIIFSISDGFGMVLLWISNRWRDLLPRNGSGSLWGSNFTQNSNFIKDVTGRNKNIKNINFGLTTNSSFRLRLKLSLCMRSSFHSNLPEKLSKCKTNVQNFHTMKNFGPNYSKRLLILILRLAAPCHRITL